MGQLTLIVACGAAAIAAGTAGIFGYSNLADDHNQTTPAHLLKHHAALQKRCLSTIGRAIGDRPLMKLYFSGKLEAGCACLSERALTGSGDREAELIATALPAKMDFELAVEERRQQKREALAESQSQNSKKLLHKKSKRAEKKAEKAFRKQVKSALARLGVSPKRAHTILVNAEERAKACFRTSRS